MSKTMIGRLFSMQRVKAVMSITFRFLVSDRTIFFRSFVLFRIRCVNTVHSYALEDDISGYFYCPEGTRCIGGKIRNSGYGPEYNHPALFQVTYSAAADIGFCDLFHLDGAL